MSFAQTVLTRTGTVTASTGNVTVVPARAAVHIRLVHVVLTLEAPVTVAQLVRFEDGAGTLLMTLVYQIGMTNAVVMGDGEGVVLVNQIVNSVVRMDNNLNEDLIFNIAWVYLPVP